MVLPQGGGSDGLEVSRSLVLKPERMAQRRAREALAASAQNRHPSYPRLGELGHDSPR